MENVKRIGQIFVLTLVIATVASAMTCSAELGQPETCLFEKDLDNQLLIHAPPSVMEGEDFLVTVTADGIPIHNARVLFWNGSYYTINGSVWLEAPFVAQSTIASIYAEKDGYLPAETEILIIDGGAQLMIDAPSSVLEGEGFEVFVTDAEGLPIDGALVEFADQSCYTINGSAWLTAPMVNQTTIEMIYAEKEGYLPDEAEITIIDNSEQLVINAPSSVWEGDDFSVHVSDANGLPIDGALVEFANQSCYTQNGSAMFTAPWVEQNTEYSIHASKDGYLPDMTWITVKNSLEQNKNCL